MLDSMHAPQKEFLGPRQPPYNLELEQAFLGALLANNKIYERVSDYLLPTHFVDERHGKIYAAVQTHIGQGMVADVLTLKSYFENAWVLEDIGGTAYLTYLITCMVGVINAPDYAKLIVDLWRRRVAIDALQRGIELAYDSSTDIMAVVGSTTDELDHVSLGDGNYASTPMADAMMDAIEHGMAAKNRRDRIANGEKMPPLVKTGLAQVDEIIGELEGGDVVILGARPKTGKSALALQIALTLIMQGVPVLYISTEMRATQLGRRALAMLTSVSSKSQKQGDWSQASDKKLTDAWATVSKFRLFGSIEDCPGMNMRIIGAKAKAFARKHPGVTGLVITDHIHDLSEMHEDAMTAAIGKIAIGAKTISKTIGWPMMLLSQMSRAIESRDEKRPEPNDLYGGSQLEAIASAIMLLHRPDRYLNPKSPEKRNKESSEQFDQRYQEWKSDWERLAGKLELYIPMVRDGEPGFVELKFDGPSNRSTEIPRAAEGYA